MVLRDAYTETVFIHSGSNCIAEYAKGAAPTSSGNEYVYGGGIDSLIMLSRSSGSEKLAITRNRQWSISSLVNSSGSVVERYTYAEFGKRTILAADGSTVRTSSNYNMPYGYTSRRHEPKTGLMYFRARYYDPVTGEFISRDPLEYVDGMSQYRGYFVPGMVDPLGQSPELTIDLETVSGFVNFDWKNWWFGWRVNIHIKPPTAGMLMQYVEVQANAIACDDDCPPKKELRRLRKIENAIEGSDHPLYEIWPIANDGGVLHNGKTVDPDAEKSIQASDNFNWLADADLRDTRGKFTIDGTFSFFSGAAFPATEPDRWMKDLPVWNENPMEGQEPEATKKHSCTLYWDFCDKKKSVILITSEGDVWRKSL